MYRLSVNERETNSVGDTYANAILRTLSSLKPPPSPTLLLHSKHHRSHTKTVPQSVINELVNGSSDNQPSLADPSSLSSSTSSLLSSSSYSSLQPSGNCFTIEAHLPLDKTNIQQFEKFQRLLTRLDYTYNHNQNMATTALPPLSTSSTSNIQDRYLFRSLSNDNQRSTARKSKYNSNRNPIASTTPPSMRKRYKFSSTPQDQNTNNTDVYKFSTSPTEQRSQSTGSDRYYFRPDDSTRKPEQRLTYVRSGDGLEQRNVTFIDGASTTPDKHSSQTIIPDTPYLFSKPTESQRYPSATSSVNPEDLWLDQRKQPHIIFDSITDSSPTSQLKRARTTSLSPDRTQIKHSPARMDTVTSTNGSLSTIQRSPANKTQNVRFDPSSTQRSYLSEARERLAGKQRGRSPQAFQQSVDRLASSTTQKYLQQQILSPPIPFQAPQQHHYVSQYYAHEEGEPPIDYPMDSDDDEPSKRSATTTTTTTYNRGSLANRTHTLIMKNVNKSLIDRNYLAGTDRIRQLEQNAHRYLRFMENQALQRELNHDLIRCFSSTYLDDLRREEIRHNQARLNMRPYTYEDIQDIHMSSVLESYKMKKAIDRERRVRLNASFDGQITASTPTSSILAGHLSPLLSNYSPIMTGSLNENIDVHSGGFEIDRRSQKSQISSSQTPTGIRPGHGTPGPAFDLFYDIMQDRFRGVDASIAGQVSTASQYKKRTDQPTTTTTSKAIDHDSDIDPGSYASLWSDDDDEQMIVDNQRQSTPQQKQLSRYWSTVNRSLLDRPSDLIADFYISKLNQGMQESVRHVENIARDKALMRQNRNREFVDEPTNKLGRSLSAEHLYQVRKEHLRYKQPFNTPTSFTVEDVEDIYKPFVLENYKRKIAIELERRRRERQGQLMAGMTSPPSYVSDIDSFNALKATQPPIIESPLRFRQSQLDRTRIVHTNDYDPQRSDIIVPRPVVQTREIPVGRARRTLTDDGSADVIHHVGIISPPLSYSIVAPTPKRTTISTSTRNQYETPQVTTISPPDFVDRNQTLIRQQRIHPHIAQPTSNELVDSPLTTTQQVLIKDSDHDPNLRRPVQIITSIETDMVTSRRPQARIYTSSPQAETVRVCHADRVETDSGNYDLSMVNIRPIVTLNQGEIRELSFIAQEAQRLQIPTHDYDHAMIMLSPDQIQDQHNIHRQPLLLAAANIDLIYEEPNEQVTRHVDPHVQHERTNLIMPIAEHMAKVEQDIPVFENLSSANIILPARNKLQEVPHDSGIVSLNTSQASEQPMIFNASRINRLETSDDQHLENLHEDDYYRRRIRALDLLRSVDTDPNANIQPVHNQPMEIFENTTDIPTPKVQREHTTLVDDHRMDQMQTLEHTDKPIVYESTESNRIEQMPGSERLTSSDIRQDIQTTNRAEENQIQWGQIRTQPERRSTENRLSNVDYEQVKPMSPTSSYEQRDNLRLTQEPLHAFETPKRPTQNVVYNYGEENEAAMHRASSIESDKDLQNATKNLARVEYDRRSLSSLDDITQPISYHPPVQTNRDQQHQAMELDVEPMAVREETALENEVSYDGSFGRASFTQPIQPLNAPRTLAQTDLQTMLLEDLTTATSTAVHAQHATSSTDTEQPHNIFERIEENNRIPIVVYDTDWTDEKVQPISNEFRTNFQNAQQKYSKTIEYQKAKIVSPKSILSREHYEEIDNNNQELAQQIDTQPIPTDHLIERMEIDTNLSSNSNQLNTNSPQAILCQPIDQQIQMNDEDAPSISDDSLHVRDQQRSNVNTTQNLPLENPLRSTAFLTFNYAQHSEQLGPTWQRSSDQQIGSPIHSQEQHLQIEREQISPRYLPSIASVDNYVSEFQQTPLLHENVRIENTERIPLLPPTHVNQIQPIYRVRQQQISVDDDYDPSAITSIRPDRTDQVNISSVDTTRIESVPVTVNIDVRVRPTQSETSSLADQEGVLDPFEQNIESEQHLPLVDQISLTYSASIRSIQDETQRAIERYEQEHPYFSRSLPREWIEPPVLPHDEQLVEQWIVERNLDIIQQQVELTTNQPCESVVNATATAIATDAYSMIGERFEDEQSSSSHTPDDDNQQQNIHVAAPVIVSHCSPTSDYETDSLDKDNDTTSTTTSVDGGLLVTAVPITITVPAQTQETISSIPTNFFLETLANEDKDSLVTIGVDQKIFLRAQEDQLEPDEDFISFNFDEHHSQELLNPFFEPAHFQLPIVNELSIYQLSTHQEYPICSPTNLSQFITHNDENISVNQYRINQHEILSIAHINHQLDELNENLENLSQKYDPPMQITDYDVQSINAFSEPLHVQIIEPPVIIEQSNETIVKPEEYLEHATTEIINPSADSSPVYPLHSPFNRTDKARQSTESYNLERLPVQHYLELNLNTPTASMRRVRPDRPGSYTEDIIMDSSTHTRIESPIRSRQDDLKYASTTTRDHSEQLPPQHLPVDYVLDRERARIVPETNVSFSELNKNDEVLIRDTIVQHISEDEKSTSSEEVIFEEWSEEFRCRRTDEYDKNTNRLIRTTIDETSGRVKSDVIKEEYKEKNERIKGHKSYDVVKEVYRRVPAHSVDPKTSTIVTIEPATSHVYEEIPQVPHSTTSSLFERQVPVEHTPRNRQWSFEDNYTTEIVYDSKLARDIESSARAQRTDTRFDSSTTPPSSTTTITAANYDRVRPGQYPSMPSASQATISTVPSSNYDRISNIVTPSTHFADRRQTERDEIVSEEYHVEFEQQQHSDRRSPSIHRQELTIPTKQQQQRDETSEEDVSDPYVVTGDDRTYHGLTTIVNEAGQRRDSDWRNKLKQIYAPSSDEERFDQFGKSTNGHITAQHVAILPTNNQQRFKEVQVKVSTRDRTLPEPCQAQISPSSRHAVKEILVCVSRGASPEKQSQQTIYHLQSSSDEDEQINFRWIRGDSSRSRDVTKRVITTTTVDDDRPQPPKRSSSSSSFIDERRSRFEQQQQQAGSTSPFSTNVIDRPSAGRVGELRNAFETTITTTNLPDDSTKYKSSVSSNLNERRRIFEEQEQLQRRSTQLTSNTVVPQRRVHRISGRRRSYISDEFQANERRMSETHTAPSRVQSSDRLGRTGFDTIKSTLESSMVKSTEHETPVDTRIKDKRTISSIDSDLSGSPPPIYQSTPKSTQQKRDDLGDESEDELSDPTTTKQDQSLDSRRRSSKPRSRDFSQSTPQTYDASYLSHRSKSTFNETNMENILSHVPTSKGKGLLIELSPHISHETPITTTTKPIRDPHKPAISSDSGIFDYSTATSHHVPASSTSWRNNASSSVLDDVNYTPTNRDSGVYIDSAATASSRYGRRLASDTDQTTIHGGDDSVSRSTFKYDTEIISNDQLNQPTQTRNIRRQITNSPPSDYENIANYHSGISSLRQVPITTQSRSNSVKPLVVDEIETIETETHVECQVQRTHEIKESTTTERASSPGGPKRVVTTTTTTTTTTALPPARSPESSSDETPRLTTSAKRVLLNERPQYYETGRSIRAPPESTYTPTSEIRQQTQTYRLDSPPSDSLSYPLPPPPQIPHTSTVTTRENDLIRVEETGFKPIQSPTYRSTNRALSAGPRSVEVTSLSPPSQVTFGTYSPSEVIAIVRVPDLTKTPGARQSPSQTIKHGASEPEIYARAKQEDEQRSKLHYQRVHAASYRPPPPVPVNSDYQQRQARSRIGAYETPNEYSSPLGVQTRSSSYHSALHEQDRQQQQQQQQQTSESYPYSPSTNSTYRRQVQRRSGSLGNLLGSNIEFEIEIEKRPPQQPEQPTVVALDQPTRAIVTTSRDGRVSIQNIAARPGNTVVINSDFHSSDRSLNRSSGYFSSDELRSQGITTNYSSDEQSSAAVMNQPNGQFSSAHARRFRNNDPTISRLPAHYRPKSNTYQPLNNENFERVNQMVHRYHRQSNGSTGFNDTIDQIDALYNNLNIQSNEDYRSPQTNNNNNNNNSPSTYDFSKTPSTLNRRKNLSPNSTEYAKRYSSTGFQHMQSQYDSPTSPTADNSTLLHLVSPPIVPTNDRRRYDAHRAFSDNENLNPNQHNRNWAASSSLTDLVSTTPIRPSQSLSSSGILADYGTPGSISPNSGFGSTQNVVLQQNRLNSQQQIVQRNRTSVKQMKQKSAAKKKSGNHQGQYSDEEDENDSAGGHDSPLSDGGRPQVPSRYSNRHQ